MDAIFVGVFQNDSYIHQYISFYFVAPVAILAGIAIDRLITFLQGAFFRNEPAHDLVTKLPPGKKRFFNVGHFSFCFWNPTQLATK
jgi:hypothetical protein